MKTLLTIALVTFSVWSIANFGQVDGLECYSCEPRDEDCNDPYKKPDSQKTPCDSSEDTCVKAIAKAQGVTGVVRQCYAGAQEGCHQVEFQGFMSTVCACKTDLCNAAIGKSPPLFLLMSALLLLVLRSVL